MSIHNENVKIKDSSTVRIKTILYKRVVSILSISIILVILTQQSFACSIFNKQQDDTVLVGNNEDYLYSVPSSVWFIASNENTYGRVCFANSTYVQGGMNEKGLFYDGATCPPSKVPFKEGNTKVGFDLGEIVISKCSNVQEALEMVKGLNIPDNFNDHILFADKSGNSAVVEWVENELRIIPREKDYQVATNFWLSNTKLGGYPYPCPRFDKAKQMLEEKSDISVSYFTDILKATSQDWGDGGTRYSNVYDLKNREVYVYYNHDFEKSIKYNLDAELSKLSKGEKKIYNLAELSYTGSETAEIITPTKPEEGENQIISAVTETQKENESPKNSNSLGNNNRYKRFVVPSVIIFSLGLAIFVFVIVRKNIRFKEKI